MLEFTLLDLGERNLYVASLILDDGDEIAVNMAAFNLQQAAELYIKHHLELSGVAYKKTHDIAVLLRQFDENNVAVPAGYDILLSMAAQLTNYEAKPRYLKNYLVARKEVLVCLDLLRHVYAGTCQYYPVYVMIRQMHPCATLDAVNKVMAKLGIAMEDVPKYLPVILEEVVLCLGQ